ncbi:MULTISPECIES: sulfate/molybdate ABC transporter ATP-binding protein [unclassified Campylobacter]|uniref:sulfate/molybdate ABC transporter ATP-binding protein n=1 Tax=unclassified Campylobacter TaxID=2593542 RepID=UPI001237AF55|nr:MULTISPECIES: ATP-binding cassette domain-containing protein [unclassified Campylobacter]KAA6226472.1 ATP-binding cassette domain-containing protein [Campylobacter sp. LR185c]KAA6228607.1 ATP-binding cassette domain-containing protein [Campylobacter sp. LR196d]KAA6229160.1 ATP-binding cassette domain-containing protein [Campylobacter sp. LR286c]KAA6233951.1 ATP-binding cassette domain-containing protein [Campylobacter sp. LR291e]KAA8603473.1 molybdenum ABC transporter ATP-binding protein [C
MINIDIKHPINTVRGLLNLEFKTSLEDGKISVLFGESGVGKTTLLRIISGLLTPNFGRLDVENEVWLDTKKGINLAPQKRRIGFMFQDYALFPNLNVRQNVSYASNDKKRIDELLEVMELKKLEHSYPKELSGGQAQRVALARALARKPKILLLDEPLSALDFKMRSHLQDELAKTLNHFGITTLLVSHDLSEIYKLGQRVIEIKNGRIVKDAKTKEFFTHSNLSAKLRLSAVLLDINKSDIMYVLTLLLNQDIIKITLSQDEFENTYKDIKIGDTLVVSIKAFNPLIIGKL